MLKVYWHQHEVKIYPDAVCFLDNSAGLPFEIEPEGFQFTNVFEESDVIVAHHLSAVEILLYFNYSLENKLFLITAHTHTHEGEGVVSHVIANKVQELQKFVSYPLNVKYLTCSQPSEGFHSDTIFYDGYYNREKCYFTEYDRFMLVGKLWSGLATKKMYSLETIARKSLVPGMKKFLSPNKIHVGEGRDVVLSEMEQDRIWFRYLLSKHLSEEHGFFSDFQQQPPLTLDSQEQLPETVPFYQRFWWAPVHNRYYQNSIVSVYVETLVRDSVVRTATEKTFDPLIKGHFILPFGYSGLVRDLKNVYGFRFPDWIDYSYDEIEDNRQRFERFIVSFEQLKSLDLETLINYNNQDINILAHNRSIFFESSYDSLYQKLLPLVKNL